MRNKKQYEITAGETKSIGFDYQYYYFLLLKLGNEKIDDDNDKSKLTEALKLLNDFIELIITELKSEFQFILLEHASKDYWEKADLKHFHLVDEFRNGNALIRLNEKKESDEGSPKKKPGGLD